jgi:FlaA1/EpsC-like NDP-sugar epimerase
MVQKLLSSAEVSEVVVLSRDEEKQLDMRRKFADPRLKLAVCDVRDRERLLECVYGDILFHAAALKIIDVGEHHPGELIKTNLCGTENVMHACQRNKVGKALLISTDKAVKPVNAYGMTKALAEKIWLSGYSGGPLKRVDETVFAVTRYGNVLGSRGSIVPYFRELVSSCKPLPITDASMSRFVLTLKLAISLVMYAAENARGGEIFVPRCPACNVMDVVEAISGRKDYPVRFVGIRPGEKIAEVLVSEEESWRTMEQSRVFIIHPYGSGFKIHGRLGDEYTSANARQLSVNELLELLKDVE